MDGGQAVGYDFERAGNHPWTIPTMLGLIWLGDFRWVRDLQMFFFKSKSVWFDRFWWHFPIGSYIKTLPYDDGHLRLLIYTKNTHFVKDNPVSNCCGSSSSSKYSASFNLKIIALVRVRKRSVLFTSEYVNMYMFQNRKSAG